MTGLVLLLGGAAHAACLPVSDAARPVVHQQGVRFDGPRAKVEAVQLGVGDQAVPPVDAPDSGMYGAPYLDDPWSGRIERAVVPAAAVGEAFGTHRGGSHYAVGEAGQHNLEAFHHAVSELPVPDPYVLRVGVADLDGDGKGDLFGLVETEAETLQVVFWAKGGHTRWVTETFGEAVPVSSVPALLVTPTAAGHLVTHGGCCGGGVVTAIPIRKGLVEGQRMTTDQPDAGDVCVTSEGTLHRRVAPR